MYVPSEIILCAFGTLVAILLRACTTLHPYSGKNKPPMYGDYEAQRHWMEITVNLPITEWYHNTTRNNLDYWGLDYPPLTAYHMYFCGLIAEYINPDYVKLNSSRGYESDEHKLFMRYTVLTADVILFVPGIILYFVCTKKLYSNGDGRLRQRRRAENDDVTVSTPLAIILGLFYPGVILIDHGHFQYNCISLAFFVIAVMFLSCRRDLLASLFFCFSLNYKQMELYHAFPFFLYLLSSCVPKPGMHPCTGLVKLFAIGVTVTITFLIIWLPFLLDFDNALQVLYRLFPIARGVFEDKVANVWCALNIFYKFKARFCNLTMMRYCMFATLTAIFPSSVDLFIRPNVRKFVPALINSSLSFFLFSYQVHEKSILLVALPVLLYLPRKPIPCFWFLVISTFSMLPLLTKDGLVIAFLALTIFYVTTFMVCLEYSLKACRIVNKNSNSFVDCYNNLMQAATYVQGSDANIPDVIQIIFKQIVNNYAIIKTIVLHLTVLISFVGCLFLTILIIVFEPPDLYPDLFSLLISVYSCVHFVGFFIYFNIVQLKIPQEFEDVRHVKIKTS